MTAANKEEDNEPLSQEELDKLVAGDEPDEPASGDAGDELDEPASGGAGDELDEPASGGAGDELDEPASGGALDEPLSQEELDKLVAGDEPDEPASGGALDEPLSQEELDKPVAGDEPDEPASGGELDEPLSQEELDKPVAGDELDEPPSGDELDEPISGDKLEPEIDYQEIPQEKDAEDPERKYKGKKKLIRYVAEKYKSKRKLFIAAAIGLCLLTGAGYLSLQNKKEKVPQVKKLPVMAGRSLVFDSFVIPFREHDKFAYLSLDISFRLMDKELAEEMTAKRDQLRGIIYDLLREEINKTG
ncbi:MAG: hypothetical protein V3S16_16825, partial [Candidatus Desulfatibia sp.]